MNDEPLAIIGHCISEWAMKSVLLTCANEELATKYKESNPEMILLPLLLKIS